MAKTTRSDVPSSPERDEGRSRNDVEPTALASLDKATTSGPGSHVAGQGAGQPAAKGTPLSKRQIPFWGTCSFLLLYGFQELPLVLTPSVRDALQNSSHAMAIVLGGFFAAEALRRAWDTVTSFVQVEGTIRFGRRKDRDPRPRG